MKSKFSLPLSLTLGIMLLLFWIIGGKELFYSLLSGRGSFAIFAWAMLALTVISVFALFFQLGEKLTTVQIREFEVGTNVVERIAKANPKNIQEIAASQIQLLNTYHNLVLDQARKSFTWALVAAVVGLLFFIVAVSIMLVSNIQSAAIISLISGGLVEVISGINFYLYGQTSRQLSDFQIRLDSTQKFLLANSICESLDGTHKQKARSELIKSITLSNIQKSEVDSKPAKQETS